jgi:Fe-S cluster assembly protein SufD
MAGAALRDLLPTRRVEAWKYSDLRAALADFDLPERDAATVADIPVSAPFAGGGIIARLARDAGALSRLKIGAGEQRELVEYLDAPGLSPSFLEAEIDRGGSLTRIVVQRGGEVPLSEAHVRLAANARFRQVILSEGAKLARIETHVSIEGEGAGVELNGIYMVGAGRHADLTSVVAHHAGGASTRQLIKGVARKGGRGVFQGKIYVAHDAQQTDARQHHQALMLEEGAEIDAKPELEIFADDVQCAHGNAIGALDESQLFYARSRGIPEAEARALLVEAFLAEAIAEDLPEAVREELLGRVRDWLRGGSS